ncbi:hypothetical protein C0989_000631 [Termitomyces sp. Mn162]|nr:hypothetical protein C0989_000631 [Termitomyces sp. Mn162]
MPKLVIDKSLATLPRRKTDKAIIMRTQDSEAGNARVFKLNAVPDDPILLSRCAHRPYRKNYPLMERTELGKGDTNRSTDLIVLAATLPLGISHRHRPLNRLLFSTSFQVLSHKTRDKSHKARSTKSFDKFQQI